LHENFGEEEPMPKRLMEFIGVIAVLIGTGCAAYRETIPPPEATAPAKPDLVDIRAIAEEGFIYGLPIVMNYAVMTMYCVDPTSGQYKVPFNRIFSERRAFTHKDAGVITPNGDTPYSMAWLDLRTEPFVVSVPAVEKKRYYAVMLNDGNTFNYGYIGSRATGNDAGNYLVAGPGWDGPTPAGIKKVFRSSTQFSLVVFRTQLFHAKDMPNVEKIQSGYRVRPLSAYLRLPAPPPASALAFPRFTPDLVKENFFEYLDFALQFAPPAPEETDIRAKLARIGVGPGKTRNFSDLSPEQRIEVEIGMKSADRMVDEKVAAIGKDINGWRLASAFGNREFYNGDWLLRAAAARMGIYGNDAEEAVYPTAKTLANGEPLDGGRHNYTLTFKPGQLPPVNAFWSITMYDGGTQLPIRNPIDRHLINSGMLPALKKNRDGSLTIYIQKNSPGKDRESNWLPAPNGPIHLVMRLYWPKTAPPSILPPGEGTWQPPAIVKAK
jgi:hypothetical protein